MAIAVNQLAEIGGGKVVVDEGEVRALVPLALLGLLSEEPLGAVMEKFERAFAAIADRGRRLERPLLAARVLLCLRRDRRHQALRGGTAPRQPPKKIEVIVA